MKISPLPKYFLQIVFQNILCLTVLASVTAVAEEIEECCYYNPLQYSRLEVGYSWGDFIGIDEDYAEFGLFMPLLLSKQYVIFVDGREYQFRDSHWGLSVGLGARGVLCNGNLLGINAYYDNLEGTLDKVFNRVGIGIEYLTPCWDFRINGYYPVGSRNYISGLQVIDYEGGFFELCNTTEYGISKGFDAEIGAPLFCCCEFKVYGAIGPYFYDRNVNPGFWGGYARLEATLYDTLYLRVRSSYDHVYNSRTEVSALLNIPFDLLCCWKCCKDCCLDFLTQPVRRNGVIFTKDCCGCVPNWTD